MKVDPTTSDIKMAELVASLLARCCSLQPAAAASRFNRRSPSDETTMARGGRWWEGHGGEGEHVQELALKQHELSSLRPTISAPHTAAGVPRARSMDRRGRAPACLCTCPASPTGTFSPSTRKTPVALERKKNGSGECTSSEQRLLVGLYRRGAETPAWMAGLDANITQAERRHARGSRGGGSSVEVSLRERKCVCR